MDAVFVAPTFDRMSHWVFTVSSTGFPKQKIKKKQKKTFR